MSAMPTSYILWTSELVWLASGKGPAPPESSSCKMLTGCMPEDRGHKKRKSCKISDHTDDSLLNASEPRNLCRDTDDLYFHSTTP
mmetsp:Transcript_9565/g.21717  ORF Transcript_9565/g.21717 Transcript_9565/m.21717 type:complete len:85 (+) Transcript_9565:138-392(+)|eukprot:762853-Hanusia_phi.AAC.4